MEKTFVIRSYSKQEQALCYSPNITPTAARNKLMQWINLYPGLTQQLQAHGLTLNSKVFTPMQVRLIVEALGEP